MNRKKKIPQLLLPATEIHDEVVLLSEPFSEHMACVIPTRDIRVSDSGSLITDLPEMCNLRDVEDLIEKQRKLMPNASRYVSDRRRTDESGRPLDRETQASRKVWTDGTRFFATRLETSEGLTYRIRTDVAVNIMNQGYTFVQCNHQLCHAIIPNYTVLDYTRFMVKKPVKKGAYQVDRRARTMA